MPRSDTSFRPGQSGNPKGRPKVVFEIRDLAREHGPGAIALLAEMAGLTSGIRAEPDAVRVTALRELLDRGFGKATQPVSGDPDGPPVTIQIITGVPDRETDEPCIHDAE